jgi:uncharacterized RDD family membrane protein YckC
MSLTKARPAGIFARIIAFAIDVVLIGGVVMIALVGQEYLRAKSQFDKSQHYELSDTGVPVFFMRFLESIQEGEPDLLIIKTAFEREANIAFPVLLFLPWFLGLLFHAVFGRSPGKLLLGLRVRTRDGRPISAGKASVRYFGKWLSALPVFLGYIMAFAGGQALHDRMNGTVVTKA